MSLHTHGCGVKDAEAFLKELLQERRAARAESLCMSWAVTWKVVYLINNYRTLRVFLFTKNGIHIPGLQDSVPREGNFWSCSALSQMPRQEPWQSPTPGSCTLVFHSVTGMGKLLGKRGLEAETELLRAENTDRVDAWGVHTASSSPMLKAGG